MCLAAGNAVAKWKELTGPEGLLQRKWFFPRSMLHRFGPVPGMENVLYASEDFKSANRDIRFFFPQSNSHLFLVFT